MDYEHRPFSFRIKKHFLATIMFFSIITLVYFFIEFIRTALNTPDYFYNQEEKQKKLKAHLARVLATLVILILVHIFFLFGILRESLCVAATYSALLIVGLCMGAVQGCVLHLPWPHPLWFVVVGMCLVVLVGVLYTFDLIKLREDERDAEYRTAGWLLNRSHKKKYTDL